MKIKLKLKIKLTLATIMRNEGYNFEEYGKLADFGTICLIVNYR